MIRHLLAFGALTALVFPALAADGGFTIGGSPIPGGRYSTFHGPLKAPPAPSVPGPAQSYPAFNAGDVPTAAEWRSYFSTKQDSMLLGTGMLDALTHAPGDTSGGLALAGSTGGGGGSATLSYAPTGNYANLPNVGSSAAASVAIPSGSPTYLAIVNYGSVAVSVKLSSLTTFETGDVIPPSGTLIEPTGAATTVYAITKSGTTNVQISGATLISSPVVDSQLHTDVTSPIPPQTSGAAVPIGAVKLCDQASSANPLTPCLAISSRNAVYIEGATASGSAFNENPTPSGGRAATTSPTTVADGQKVALMTTTTGKIVTHPYAPSSLTNNGNGSSTTTAAITIHAASGNANLKEYTTALSCGRSDTGTTAITLAISDATTTITKVLPNAGSGGLANFVFPVPLSWVANHAVTVTPSSGVTTLYCDAQGYNGP